MYYQLQQAYKSSYKLLKVPTSSFKLLQALTSFFKLFASDKLFPYDKFFVWTGPYPTYVSNPDTGRTVPVVQAFYYTKYLGHLRLDFDDDGELKRPVERMGVTVKYECL